jgi:hypothetical protein
VDQRAGVNFAKNIEPASWITSRLHPLGQDVGSVVPKGFDAYARVFHPPRRRMPDGTLIPVRWQDIAAANGRSIQAELQRSSASGDPSAFSSLNERLWNEQPEIGSMPRDVAERLVGLLAPHTRTPEACWFAVWEGFGDLRLREGAGPRFSIPHRNLFLLAGHLEDVRQTLSVVDWSYRSPNLWWPDDRAWCVGTEIDFSWTYVGGSASCIQQILADPVLEALPTASREGNWMEASSSDRRRAGSGDSRASFPRRSCHW